MRRRKEPVSRRKINVLLQILQVWFVGVMLDWIKDGMQEDYSTIVKKNESDTARKYQ